MFKKSFAAIALAVLAVIAVPTAANAAGYVPVGNISVSGTPAPGSVVEVAFTAGSFTPGESVSFTLTGENAAGATLAVVNSQSLVKTAADTGAVALDVTLPADASGTYTTTATGLTSGTVGTASLTVASADAAAGSASGSGTSTGGLASTGYDAPMLAIWAAAGALLLGIALMVALTVVRRQRANA
jgi:hypothetical protein